VANGDLKFFEKKVKFFVVKMRNVNQPYTFFGSLAILILKLGQILTKNLPILQKEIIFLELHIKGYFISLAHSCRLLIIKRFLKLFELDW